jgi:hypothetical protein
MKSSSASVAVIAACLALGAEARTWQSVINSEIYRQSGVDTSRLQLKAELDPFFFPEVGSDVSVAPQEQASPTPAPQHANDWITMPPVTDEPSASPSSVTDEPSTSPSSVPSLSPTAPTSEPTSRENDVDGNGGCHTGTLLYQVNMYDAWGDGWVANTMLKVEGIEDQNVQELPDYMVSKTTTTNDGNMTVTITKTIELNPQEGLTTQATGLQVDPLGVLFQGGLRQGSHGTADICLKPGRCYKVTVSGGDWLQEDSWDIRPVTLGAEVQEQPAFVEGGAPVECSFSIPDENGDVFCPVSCNATLSPEATGSPGIFENPVVVSTPSIEDYLQDNSTATDTATDTPTVASTDAPTDADASTETYVPTETEAPTETDAPIETYVPTETEAPTETDAPIETDAPTETEARIETDAPTGTDAPFETDAPMETEARIETDAPTETEPSTGTEAPGTGDVTALKTAWYTRSNTDPAEKRKDVVTYLRENSGGNAR